MSFNITAIQEKLNEKNATLPCHRCGGTNFIVVSGYSNISTQTTLEEVGNITLGGPSLPIVNIGCTNCGALTSHALGALGLLPNNEN